jgi:hypothetical protein
MGIAIIRIEIERDHLLGVICYLLDRGYSFQSRTRSKRKIGMELRLLYGRYGSVGVVDWCGQFSGYRKKAEVLYDFLGYSMEPSLGVAV